MLWLVRILALLAVFIGAYVSLSSGRLSAEAWLNFVVIGIGQGAIYALIALGYTMVYGVLGFINFAHGEVFMTGAMVGAFAANALFSNGLWTANPFLSLIIVLLISMTTSTLVAILLERVAYRRLRNAPRLIPLITSIGASFFIQYAFLGLFGAQTRTYPALSILEGSFSVLGFEVSYSEALVIGAAIVMMFGLWIFVEKTRTGRALRAVAEDKEIAALMGVNVNRSIVLTFAVGGAMAGAAALLFGVVFRTVFFFSGFLFGIKAFTAAVLGGIGNIFGAMLGGVTLGIVESVGPSLVLTGLGIPSAHQLKDVVAFLALVLVLIFKPTGLLGERLSEERA
ncbi:MAG: branched-chain amino acid ABC transporter permease [Acidimicrobiia bacterium]